MIRTYPICTISPGSQPNTFHTIQWSHHRFGYLDRSRRCLSSRVHKFLRDMLQALGSRTRWNTSTCTILSLSLSLHNIRHDFILEEISSVFSRNFSIDFKIKYLLLLFPLSLVHLKQNKLCYCNVSLLFIW